MAVENSAFTVLIGVFTGRWRWYLYMDILLCPPKLGGDVDTIDNKGNERRFYSDKMCEFHCINV